MSEQKKRAEREKKRSCRSDIEKIPSLTERDRDLPAPPPEPRDHVIHRKEKLVFAINHRQGPASGEAADGLVELRDFAPEIRIRPCNCGSLGARRDLLSRLFDLGFCEDVLWLGQTRLEPAPNLEQCAYAADAGLKALSNLPRCPHEPNAKHREWQEQSKNDPEHPW
jgi:hypothetical protein